ncbi:MAG: menaquinone biosynthesis protein [Candidatus Poseidoniales archaeon]|jgi:chorismate dehydratase
MEIQTWQKTIGRVAFLNCDPLYYGLAEKWKVLAAPPAWLTGHLLRKDCLIAPIPAADWALNREKLILLPKLGIISDGPVGSVLLFGHREIKDMRDVALPTDSATSRRLLIYLLNKQGFDPRPVQMGPDLESMLDRCDGALLIGDRALHQARMHPELVRMDLGKVWKDETGFPMVFAVFAAHVDAPIKIVKSALNDLLAAKNSFEESTLREKIIAESSERSSFSIKRVEQYFEEVLFDLDEKAVLGLELFISEVLGLEGNLNFITV